MSRPYRVRVKHSLRRIVRAEDSVTSTLELLPILEADELAGLLASELEVSGFEKEGDVWVRRVGGDIVQVDPATGEVKVTVGAEKQLNLQSTSSASTYDPTSQKQVEGRIRRQLEKQLEKKAEEEQSSLRSDVADRMEGVLQQLRPELDQIVNRTTAAALKTKAGRMGAIKEITEDDSDGSLTIVVEV